MRTTRLLGAAAAAALVAIAPLSATIAAAAEVHGVGTGSVSSTLLQVDVGKDGSVLSVRVLGDDGTSSIDPSKGAPSSSTSLTPLKVSSGAVPALNITSPSVSTSSTGAEDKKTVSPAIPSNPAFTGSLTANLSSIVDQVGARSGLAATLQNLSVAGGLLNVPSAKATLGTNAASVESMSTRSISIPSIEVLNLGAVLKGVGLPLDKLPLKALYDLLGGLGITLPDLSDPAKVVASVNTAIDSLKGQTGALTTAICASVDSALSPIGGIAGTNAASGAAQQVIDTVHATAPGAVPATGGATPSVPLPIGTLRAAALPVSCSSVTGTVADLVTSLQNVVGGVVTSVLDTLDHTSLLSVQGIELGLVADAKSTVAASVANVTGTIGSVKVGSLTVPAASGLDLTAPASVLNAAGATVSGAVGQVLGLVNAQLANMVKVDVLQIQKLVAANGAYTTATAGLTALKATITPPALLTGAALNVTGTAGDLLGSIGTAVPPLAPAMGTLEGALGGLNLLSAASTITVGQLSSTSAFRAVAAAAPTSPGGSDLPRTGSNAAVPAIAAVLVGGMALGIRRFLATLVA